MPWRVGIVDYQIDVVFLTLGIFIGGKLKVVAVWCRGAVV